jgi:hypothetical protein
MAALSQRDDLSADALATARTIAIIAPDAAWEGVWRLVDADPRDAAVVLTGPPRAGPEVQGSSRLDTPSASLARAA